MKTSPFTLAGRSNACNTRKRPMTSRRTRGHPNVFGHFERQKMVPRQCHVDATSAAQFRAVPHGDELHPNCVVTWKWDAGPPIDDVEAGKSDVDPGKSDVEEGNADVACHVSRGLGGFHSTVTFARTSLGTRLCFARHHALTARCPPRCHGSSRTVSSCSYCWTSPCGERRYS